MTRVSRVDLKKRVERAWFALPEAVRKLPVVVAVSGGMDSTALADTSQRLKQNFVALHWAHVNYHLRAPDSDREEAHLRQWARELGVSLHVRSLNPRKPPPNLQAWARRERFKLFEQIIAREKMRSAVVWLAHHLQDQGETVLLRLIRGADIKGLGAMSLLEEWRASDRGSHLWLFRPLLEVPRDSIAQYSRARKLKYFEDRSNCRDIYLRNRIRSQVLPLLEKENPRILDNLHNVARSARQADTLLRQLAATHLSSVMQSKRLNRNKWNQLPEALRVWVLKAFLEKIEIASSGWKQLIPRLLKALPGSRSERFWLSQSRMLLLGSKWLSLQTAETLCKKTRVKKGGVLRLKGEGDYVWPGRGRLQARQQKPPKELKNKNNKVIYLNTEYASFPLFIREVRNGDRFRPIGMSGSKSVKRFLMDRKIPQEARDVLLLTNGRGDPIWVLGHQIDERAKVRAQDKRVLRLAWQVEKH